ncbi:unnamed protein product [Blepharisma stoltei]|uniref:Uncharacterized protein n=1 Tax=Blepharisma stoltei TaxID=1481888 RepID=A0AAU9IDX1_9CILI|nr:unnamed protein product [Blepharisma stoltei]
MQTYLFTPYLQESQPDFTNESMINALENNNKHLLAMCLYSKSLNEDMTGLLTHFEMLKNHCYNWKDPSSRPPTKEELIWQLTSTRNFQFSLKLASGVTIPVCKKKTFVVSVDLKINTDVHLDKSFKIELEAALYLAENPPVKLTVSKAGKPPLIGNTKTVLCWNQKKNCFSANFKLKANEVSSHYRNGWFFLVIMPENNASFDIKPLVIDNFNVKAKQVACVQFSKNKDYE